MQRGEETDQFQALEEKIDSLIKLVASLRKEKELLAEQIHFQEEKIADLNAEMENLKAARDKAKLRILSLLEKMEQSGV